MDPSKKQILVAYSSGYGVTREIAEEIARILRSEKTLSVDCRQIDLCESIDEYDAVVIGTSLRADLPLANVRDFFVRFRWVLNEKQTAMFVVSISSSTPQGAEQVCESLGRWLADHYPWVEPISMAAFGGKVDFARINEVMQIFVRHIMENKGVSSNGSYDARNWQDIRAWADHLAARLAEPVEHHTSVASN